MPDIVSEGRETIGQTCATWGFTGSVGRSTSSSFLYGQKDKWSSNGSHSTVCLFLFSLGRYN